MQLCGYAVMSEQSEDPDRKRQGGYAVVLVVMFV
jgi:hypothetical protein